MCRIPNGRVLPAGYYVTGECRNWPVLWVPIPIFRNRLQSTDQPAATQAETLAASLCTN